MNEALLLQCAGNVAVAVVPFLSGLVGRLGHYRSLCLSVFFSWQSDYHVPMSFH